MELKLNITHKSWKSSDQRRSPARVLATCWAYRQLTAADVKSTAYVCLFTKSDTCWSLDQSEDAIRRRGRFFLPISGADRLNKLADKCRLLHDYKRDEAVRPGSFNE